MTDKALLEIRKIRDKNSKKHEKMTVEERNKAAKPAVNWLLNIINKPVKIVKPSL